MSLAYTGRFRPDYGDSDTHTRIAYLAEAGWRGILNPLFMRDGAPNGLLLEWTLPFNTISMLLLSAGERFATELSGGIFILLLCAGAALCARILGSRQAWMYVVVIASFQSVMLAYAQPGRLNHHDATAALSVAAICISLLWWRRPSRLKALSAGMMSALLLWESMEAVPAMFMCFGIFMAGILNYPKRSEGGAAAFTFGGTVMCGIALTLDGPWPFFDSFSPYRMSLFHFGIVCACGISLMIAENLRKQSAWPADFYAKIRVVVKMLPALLPLLIIPLPILITHRTQNSHFFNEYFWNSIGELAGLTTAPELVITALGSSLLVFLSWAGTCRIRHASLMRILLPGMLGCSILMSCMWVRMAVYPESLSIIMGSMMLSRLFGFMLPRAALHKHSAFLGSDGTRPQIFSLILCVAVSAGTFFRPMVPKEYPCEANPAFSAWLESELPPSATVMADIWPSPSLLRNSSALRTVAGPYHGNPSGVSDVAEFLVSLPENSRNIFNRRNAEAVLLCGYAENRKSNPQWPAGSTADILASGKTVSWLSEIPVPEHIKTELKVWRRSNTPPPPP